jgi:E3 ubiquitin-protein ligase BRE1
LLERLTLKHYIQYCRNEQENLLVNFASVDYLDYRVYPAEIVRQIYHNIKNGETAFNDLIRARKAEYQMTKAKSSSAVGFSILLNGCTQQINNLYKQEQQELICIADQAKLENAYKYNAESVKYLQELKSHLQDYCSSVGVMENKHNTIKDGIKKWNGILNDRTRVAAKRTEIISKNKEKLATNIEEKRKKLAELKLQSQKLAEDHIKSTVKAHETTINLAKVKMRYNRLLDNVGKAEGAGSKIDIVSEHVFKHYKELLSCPTCKVNPKNCALTKCYHLFCEDCVMKLFKSRNRKCPECNARVGANDFHRVYF